MRQRCHGGVLDAVVENLVIDLVGKNHKTVFSCNLNDVKEHGIGIKNTCGVVWVDDDDAFGARTHFGADVVDIGNPAFFFIAEIMHGFGACERGNGCPKRIVGRRHQQLVALIEQSVRGHRD